jgi:hypothetical protein
MVSEDDGTSSSDRRAIECPKPSNESRPHTRKFPRVNAQDSKLGQFNLGT